MIQIILRFLHDGHVKSYAISAFAMWILKNINLSIIQVVDLKLAVLQTGQQPDRNRPPER